MNRKIQSLFLFGAVLGVTGLLGVTSAYACGGDGAHKGSAQLMQYDVDQDGALNRGELGTALKAKSARMLQLRDANSDGFIDAAERDAVAANWREDVAAKEKAGKSKKKRFAKGKMFERADANGDGRISAIELEAAADLRADRMFERLDKNTDGKLDAAELSAARNKKSKHG